MHYKDKSPTHTTSTGSVSYTETVKFRAHSERAHFKNQFCSCFQHHILSIFDRKWLLFNAVGKRKLFYLFRQPDKAFPEPPDFSQSDLPEPPLMNFSQWLSSSSAATSFNFSFFNYCQTNSLS